jgi:glycosyltransferase involved in cell wall biosynthesis
MKIVLAAGLYPPDIGGPSRYAHMLATELPGQGIEIVVAPFAPARAYPKLVRHLAYAYQLWHQSKGCEVVYALDPISVGVPAAIVAYLRRVPLIIRLGGDYAWEQGVQRFGLTATLDEYTKQPLEANWRVRVLAGIQRQVVRRAVAVVLPSQYLRNIVATWGVSPERLYVIYSAHTVIPLTDSRHDLRSQLGFADQTIVSISRLTPWKGMSALLDMMVERKVRGEATKLVIGGDGPERVQLEAKIKALHLESSVRMVGALSFHDVFRYVTAADVFVLNTAYEGLSHHLIEAMALGTPIVTTPVGGNPELITDGVEGLLVPVNDVAVLDAAVSRILQDASLRERLSAAGQTKAAAFASTDAIPQIAQLLRQVTGNINK